MLCNELVAITRNGPPAVLSAWNLPSDRSIQALLLEPEGDTPILVVPSVWFATAGLSDCVATWSNAFKWVGGRLVNVSSEYRSIYQARLSYLEKTAPNGSPMASFRTAVGRWRPTG